MSLVTVIISKMQSPNNSDTLSARLITVDSEQGGQRLDNFLLAQLKGVPRSRIYRMMRTGEVRVNKGRAKASYRIEAGDTIRLPPVRQAEPTPTKVPARLIAALEQAILYEDERLIVLNKPAGIAVHGGSGLDWGVIEALRASTVPRHYLELVHRLDRETSGCLMLAKRRSALRNLHEQLRTSAIGKRYLALVKGQWQGAQQQIDYPLRKNILQSGERIVRVDAQGKDAVSIFTPLQRFATATLMQVEVITGRTHQIRVHAAHHGFPLAGDEKYGDADFNRQMRQLGLKRLFLHASQLRLTKPQDDKPITVDAPLPEELDRLLRELKSAA